MSDRGPSLCTVTSPASTDSVPPQLSAGPRPAPGPAADEGLARRLRALACTAPLHDLDVRKANLAGEYGVYAMAEVALAAIDLVTLNMDFDTGADHDQIVARLLPRIAAQAPARLADAQLAAEQARYRTVQYAETLRRTLDATRRNVRAVDWLQAVPDMIAEALDHVADRYRHENAILTNIRKARDEAEDPDNKRRAAELVDIVKDCIRRHTQLQSRLLEAGPLFRAEQDRQAFAAPPARAGLDLYGQLVAPLLPLPVEQAGRVTDAFFARGTGLRTPVSVRVGDLIDI